MQTNKINFSLILKTSFVIVLFLSASVVFGWGGPSATPPSSNATGPLNTGNANQTKEGSLTLPKIFDSDDTDFYVDSNSNSILQNVYTFYLRASEMVDMENNNYYVDPSETSVFNTISLGGVSRNTWPNTLPTCPVGNTLVSNGTSWDCSSGGTVVNPPVVCTATAWSPSPETVCSGQSFVQTSNCATTRTATGTKNCAPTCISHYTKKCLKVGLCTTCYDSYWYDSCGNMEGLYQACPNGCTNGVCIEAPVNKAPDLTNLKFVVSGDNVWYLDENVNIVVSGIQNNPITCLWGGREIGCEGSSPWVMLEGNQGVKREVATFWAENSYGGAGATGASEASCMPDGRVQYKWKGFSNSFVSDPTRVDPCPVTCTSKFCDGTNNRVSFKGPLGECTATCYDDWWGDYSGNPDSYCVGGWVNWSNCHLY
ncbi:MAG: hypothetical protein V1851_02160 [Patescibacteria group bacterium]